jgi:DNA repair/transcription protein MET18/MMS19
MPSGKAPPSEAESPLMLYKDDVLGVLSVGLTSATTRNMALAGLKAMTSTRNLLMDEELGFIVHNVDQIIEGNTDEFDDARLVF